MDQKTVVLGVTGCIAAYKACELVRTLQKRGLRVKVVMTEHATRLVSHTTFRALTHEPVAVGLFDDGPAEAIHHISLAQEADVFAIAPCTANVVAKMTHGIADDLLTTSVLATTAPVVVAPAMNVRMYEHPATQANLQLLRERGITVVDADEGYLACGDEGKGRLADVDVIADAICAALLSSRDMVGLQVLVNAGPTQEPIDAVRCITNHSSGKTGYAIAQAAAERGAQVTLVSGPVHLLAPAGVDVVNVRTARDMNEACRKAFEHADMAICSAAVADYRPRRASGKKLKKGADDDALAVVEMVANPDILAGLGRAKKKGQVLVGFAAETSAVRLNAEKKLVSKKADMIVANQVGGGKAFGTEGNQVMLVTARGVQNLPYLPKRQLADKILDAALALR